MQAYELNQTAFANFALFAANSFFKKIYFCRKKRKERKSVT